eukprot:3941930-Rhodomonas_salina.13
MRMRRGYCADQSLQSPFHGLGQRAAGPGFQCAVHTAGQDSALHSYAGIVLRICYAMSGTDILSRMGDQLEPWLAIPMRFSRPRTEYDHAIYT